MTSSTIICLLLAFMFVVSAKEQWNMFKQQYNKTFKDPLEEEFRFKIFKDNKRKIAEHNQRFDLGLDSYETGMNFYGDLLHHEFVLTMNGYKRRIANRPTDDRTVTENNWAVTENERAVTENDRAVNENERTVTDADQAVTDNEYDFEDDVPESIDWRKQGAVTPVKDQGTCGSCWAFSAIGSLEAQHYFKTKSLVSLSEQNLLDCSDKYGTDGCGGGLMDRAYYYIAHNGGVSSSEAYPYTGQPGNCSYKPETLGATMNGWSNLPQGSEFHLRHAVATVGPVSVAVDASLQMFQFYKQGIYFERPCSKRDIDHGMLVVGYDSEDGQDYWIVKNSWGTSWGEGGYVRMGRNRKNLCGIATAAIYPNT